MRVKFDDNRGIWFIVPTLAYDESDNTLAIAWLNWQLGISL